MFPIVIFYSSFIFLVSPLILANQEENDDKLVLSPVELIDLLIQDRQKDNIHAPVNSRHTETTYPVSSDIYRTETWAAQTYDDAEMLKMRKVWSRWSKWSHCSVTCGEGTITRERHCAGGRCSKGELEEQRRPCERQPCTQRPSYAALDELHDLD